MAQEASSRTIPGLDGLRAISLALVLVGHLSGTQGFPIPTLRGHTASVGVLVFFVVSGYLITHILLKEIARTGSLNLMQFYFRRTLRPFPAAYALIGVTALCTHLPTRDFVMALTYTANYNLERRWELGHLWSLAVEEQFYLLWPAALLLCGVQRVRRVLVALLIIAPCARLASRYAGGSFSFLIHTDSLAAGCLLALCRDRLHGIRQYVAVRESPACMALIVALPIVVMLTVPSGGLYALICVSAIIACITVIIDWAMIHRTGIVGALLNSRPMVYAGTLSYSLYLWQQIFLDRSSTHPTAAWPLNILLALAAALASYYGVERPFLRLRDALAVRKGPRPSPIPASRAATA